MKPAKIALAALAIACSTATSLNAQPGDMLDICNSFPCFRDANETVVATVGVYYPMRQTSYGWFSVPNSLDETDGIIPAAQIFYSSANCSGPGFMPVATNPRMMQYDGHAFFAPVGPIRTFTWQSFSYPAKLSQKNGKCTTYGPNCVSPTGAHIPCTLTGAPATKVETVKFRAPIEMVGPPLTE